MLFGVWLVYVCFGLTSVGLAPLVVPITRDLGLSHTAMGSVLGVWQLVYIVAAVPCGALLDRLGPRRALFIGAMLVAMSGALRSTATGFWTLCLAVGVFGLGGPIVSAGAPKVVSQWFTGRERGLAMGIYITGPAIGTIAALSLTNAKLMPLLGADWRAVLRIWAAVAFLGGFLWLVISSNAAARSMERKQAAAARQPQMQVIAALLRLPGVPLLLVMAVGIFMFNHGLSNWLPELLRAGGMTEVEAGYWATVPTLVGIGGSLLIPRLATPDRRLAILGGLCAAAGLASVMLHAAPGPVLLVGMMLQGIARSSLITVAMLFLVEMPGVGEKHAGTAGGLFFSAAEIGGAAGPILLGLLYDLTGGFDAGLHLLAGISVLLLVGVARLGRMTARPHAAAPPR